MPVLGNAMGVVQESRRSLIATDGSKNHLNIRDSADLSVSWLSSALVYADSSADKCCIIN